MASRTQVTKIRRKIRAKNLGAKRKAAARNKGSTPKFPIHPEKK